MDTQTKKDITRLKNLLTQYESSMITKIIVREENKAKLYGRGFDIGMYPDIIRGAIKIIKENL